MTAERSSGGQLVGLVGWLLATFTAAAIGAFAAANAGSFYQDLARPEWAPPAGAFAPVWTALYLMMAVAAWLVWRARGFRDGRVALALFGAQLAFNALWTWLFFVWQWGALAFAEILLLLLLLASTLVAFWRVRKLAGLLLVPYLAWTCYAAALTFAVWRSNPGTLS